MKIYILSNIYNIKMNIFYYFSSLNTYKIPYALELLFIFIEGKSRMFFFYCIV